MSKAKKSLTSDVEKRLLLNTADALEILYFENMAMNAILERWSPPNWKSERDKIAQDPEFQPCVREIFVQFRSEMEQTFTSESTLQQIAWVLPVRNKPI